MGRHLLALTTSHLGWILTGLVASAALAILLFCNWESTASTPGLGGWGDFVGGFAGLVVLIWLVIGHLENQRALAEQRTSLEVQQMLFQEAVGALTRIASSNQVQAAETLAAVLPEFVHLGSLGDNIGRNVTAVRPTSGHLNFRNAGASVEVLSWRSTTETFVCNYKGPKNLPSGGTFQIHVVSNGPLRTAGQIEVVLQFRDAFRRDGFARIRAASFESTPEIQIESGQPS